MPKAKGKKRAALSRQSDSVSSSKRNLSKKAKLQAKTTARGAKPDPPHAAGDEGGETSEAKPPGPGSSASAAKGRHDVAASLRLPLEFFQKSCEDLAKALLGTVLVRTLASGEVLKGAIVETEAYLGGEDKAAHSFGGKETKKNKAMFMDPGTVYVYHIYGTYTCINFSSQGVGAAVLIRGIDPTAGLDTMRPFRGLKRADKGKGLKDKELASGPSKLTQAFAIDKESFNQKCITTTSLWLEKAPAPVDAADVISCSRVGVDYAAEWAKKPLRFYLKGNKSVSVRDKVAEAAE